MKIKKREIKMLQKSTFDVKHDIKITRKIIIASNAKLKCAKNLFLANHKIQIK